ncbi:MAG: MBL fold metallo-hydrolase [Candidatus Levybacteria bacterium]|nr:MBL fold metallo-hydrolase [Candidatus Levybacteria bacterium]
MSRRSLLLFSIFILSFFIFQICAQVIAISDGRLHIVVCDVGQGEGIFIRTPKGANILFDGGPDESILSCLSHTLPFWERKIDLVMLSHPHADHYKGLESVLKRYEVKRFITEDVPGNSQALAPLRDLIDRESIQWQEVYAGDSFVTKDGVRIRVVGPTRLFLESKRHSGGVDPSDVSLQVVVSYKDFDALLVGDSNVDQMEAVLGQSLPQIEMLQTPHHGSKNGLSAHVLEVLSPKIASISVGKNNYGHPSLYTLGLYTSSHIMYRRTDQAGDLKLNTDGMSYNFE